MRSLTLLAASLIGLATPALAAAQDSGVWLVRARAAHLDPADIDGSGYGLAVQKKTSPELGLSYFWSENDAVELVLPVPATLSTRSQGTDIGSFKLQSANVLAQRHYTGMVGGLRPYIGAGLNFSQFSAVQLDGGAIDLQRRSLGLVLQAGMDLHVANGWLVNLDLRKVQLSSRVSVAGEVMGRYKMDPLVASVGVCKRF